MLNMCDSWIIGADKWDLIKTFTKSCIVSGCTVPHHVQNKPILLLLLSFKAVKETLSDLLCDPEPLDRYPCPSHFEDVGDIVCPGRGTDDQPRRHAVHPHAVLRPLHRQGPAQVLDAGPSGSCSTTVGWLVGSVSEPIVYLR